MAAGIETIDTGIVGYVSELGHTWHGMEQYKQIDGPVEIAACRDVLDYPVEKIELVIPATMKTVDDVSVIDRPEFKTGMFGLVRTDCNELIYNQSVSDEYHIFPSTEIVDKCVAHVLSAYPAITIESCGTLWSGRCNFVNLLISKENVKGDDSETINRLMFSNGYGGKSIQAGAHKTRIVCDNTRHMAESQSAANKTLVKLRHTKNAADKVEQHIIDLCELFATMEAENVFMNELVEIPMNVQDVQNFLAALFPLEVKAGKGTITTRTNKRAEVETIFSDCDNLQGKIKHTRYAMMQAVTDYSQHHTITESNDGAFSFWDVANGTGVRAKTNQRAKSLLRLVDLPPVPEFEKELV